MKPGEARQEGPSLRDEILADPTPPPNNQERKQFSCMIKFSHLCLCVVVVHYASVPVFYFMNDSHPLFITPPLPPCRSWPPLPLS